MGTKRVELSAMELAEVRTAVGRMAARYQEFAESMKIDGHSKSAALWTKWAERCLSIAVKLEDCDTVAIETDNATDDTEKDYQEAYYRAERNLDDSGRPF